jgi:hypothetical protein
MWTAARVASLRNSEERDMREAKIYRLKPIGTGEGFRAKNSTRYPADYTLHLTTIGKFWAKESQGREIQVGGQTRSEGDWYVGLKHDADATAEDITVIDDYTFHHVSDKTQPPYVMKKFDARRSQ